VAGVALLVLGPDAALDPIGVLAALAGTLSMAIGVVLTKRWGRPVGLLTMTGWQLTAGGALLLPLALLVEGAPPAYSAVNLAATAWLTLVGTGVAYALWFRGIERLPVSSLTFLGLLSPVVATLLGWVVLDQTLTPAQLFGAALVVFAVVHPQRAGGATDPTRVGKTAARRRNPTTVGGREAVRPTRVGKRAARRRSPTRVAGRDGGRPVPG